MLTSLPFWLHTAALLLQLAGAYLVIKDVRKAGATLTTLRKDLAEAAETDRQHRDYLEKQFGKSILGNPIPKIPGLLEAIPNQVGPGAAQERKAIRKFIEDQFTEPQIRRWIGPTLLIAGAIVGYLANITGL